MQTAKKLIDDTDDTQQIDVLEPVKSVKLADSEAVADAEPLVDQTPDEKERSAPEKE